jgi:hypothetical protein
VGIAEDLLDLARDMVGSIRGQFRVLEWVIGEVDSELLAGVLWA